MTIQNLAQLKRALHKGAMFRILQHTKHKETIGLIREVTKVQTNAVYTKIKGQPEHPASVCNGGDGLRMDIEKACNYHFGNTIRVYSTPNRDDSFLYEFEMLNETEASA